MEWFHKLITEFQWAVAGLFGSLVAVPFQRDLKTKQAIITFVLSGVAIAHFMTQPVCYYLSIEQGSVGGIGFLLGAFGGATIAAVMKAIEGADIWALIKARFGGGSQ